MDEHLRNLRKTMKTTIFKDFTFSEKNKAEIKKQINYHKYENGKQLNDILTILNVEKTGFEIAKALLAKGIKFYFQNEGKLYTNLHKYEQEGYVQSHWEKRNDQMEKYYSLTKKGRKQLAESGQTHSHLTKLLSELPEGSA